ncbi:hypothetical protein AVEN_35506-1 [Araneus ventricosus]|uniref:Uncharacterized protein n=1 Tax=Araneus ventricosus TaxID=182803 RepID=A0A4Y2US91_ARAVE|nr:hypothetical protein AVEN_35506-1 [Araneus ventricosus]
MSASQSGIEISQFHQSTICVRMSASKSGIEISQFHQSTICVRISDSEADIETSQFHQSSGVFVHPMHIESVVRVKQTRVRVGGNFRKLDCRLMDISRQLTTLQNYKIGRPRWPRSSVGYMTGESVRD